MKVVQLILNKNGEWEGDIDYAKQVNNALVLAFGNYRLITDDSLYNKINGVLNNTNHIIYGSTCSAILNDKVHVEAIVLSIIAFKTSTFIVKTENILANDNNSYATGAKLAKSLPQEGLRQVYVIADGTFINGTRFVEGLSQIKNKDSFVSGGMCGDGHFYKYPFAGYNQLPDKGTIVAVAFYGDDFISSVTHQGGWVPFGPEREVTQSKGNILYELDNEPALYVYEKYLKNKILELPYSSFTFPLKVRVDSESGGYELVRIVAAINKEKKCLILAGDVNIGDHVQLLMGNSDRIISGASTAADNIQLKENSGDQLLIAISCFGRKIVLGDRYGEEVEVISEAFEAHDISITGFYSYGEIAPAKKGRICELHNQMMAITLISERI